ncbi:D-3-phosphoglycerate dehydrogenase (EC [Olavius sp. associated proteobacterium Delta 1]|nr:D-3-phosphoglycerate dehydrogenase (EC [Olavius sp. associated proteobacterium Delta 1]
MAPKEWETHNPSGSKRVVVTKNLPGSRWLQTLIKAGCRVELCTATDVLSVAEIQAAIGAQCDGVLGQLTEDWGDELFAALKAAGGTAYSNVAVGYNNVDVAAATKHGLPVGNTPGVLTETTAQMAVTLTFAAARRTGEAERFLRAGKYKGWLMTLFLGELLWHKTVGVIGAGRIGATYARMMVEGHKMNLIYHDIYPNKDLEEYIAAYADFLKSRGEEPVSCKRADTVEDVLREADCISVHTVLDESTHHLINATSLALMKENAILVNTSRGPVVDEAALVAHCRKHPNFRAGLDVFEDEPQMKPGLVELDNVLIVPHIASATRWTREGMATLAAANVAGVLSGYPAWNQPDILSFLEGESPKAAPSIVNAKELGIPLFGD